MLITKELVDLKADFQSKEDAIEGLAKLFEKEGRLNDYEEYLNAVYEREEQISTNLGDGIGMPHARTNAVKEAGLIYAKLKSPIKWDEEAPVKYIFMIAVPDNAGDLHLKILAKLARKLIYDEFKEQLFNAENEEKVLELLTEATGGLEV